ncbi:MAG TPA: LPXTG cell wall anchor domain-containing protein [Roseiflexaceae bacterium]|nr:LPXTG cell wall anchor domain-containing protein [Roseiflexaceae bacterium]
MIVALVMVALSAFGATAGAAPRWQATDSIDAGDQPLVDQSVTIKAVNASQDGWVTVHLDEGGKPGRVLGHSAIKKGANSNVVVKLEEAVSPGTKVWPMLHIDAGTIGAYEFPGVDAPVIVGGNIVMKQITVTEGPAALPRTGGADTTMALLIGALALLAGGGLLRRLRARV